MRATTFIGAAVAAVSALAADLTINSPASVTACRPTLLSWTAGGGAPYYLSVVGDSNPSNILEQLNGGASLTATSFTWTVDVAAGQNISIGVSDNTGATAYTASVIVAAGTGTCSSATASGAASSAAGASTAASSSAAGASSAAGSSSSSAAGKVSSATSAAKAGASSVASSATSAAAAAASSAGSTSGAGAVRAGAAGLLGAAAVAVFAL